MITIIPKSYGTKIHTFQIFLFPNFYASLIPKVKYCAKRCSYTHQKYPDTSQKQEVILYDHGQCVNRMYAIMAPTHAHKYTKISFVHAVNYMFRPTM